jgi:hypothetical protein
MAKTSRFVAWSRNANSGITMNNTRALAPQETMTRHKLIFELQS